MSDDHDDQDLDQQLVLFERLVERTAPASASDNPARCRCLRCTEARNRSAS